MRNLQSVVQRWEVLVLLAASSGVQLVCAHYLPVALYVDLPLILVLYIGWYSSPARGAMAGTVFGLAQDAIYGAFLGLNGLSKTLAGFAASFVSKMLRLEDGASRSFLIGGLSAFDSGVVFFLMMLLRQPVSQDFWMDSLLKAILTGVAGGIGSRFYDRFKFPRKDFRRVGA